MGSLFLMRFRRKFVGSALAVAVSACAPTNAVLDAENFRIASTEQAIQMMVADAVANERARQIVRACLPLQLDRAAMSQHRDVLQDAIDAYIDNNPEAAFEMAELMGLPADRARVRKSASPDVNLNNGEIVKATSILNPRLLANFGGRVLVARAAAPSSENCADGAREMDQGTLVGSFLKPVNSLAN